MWKMLVLFTVPQESHTYKLEPAYHHSATKRNTDEVSTRTWSVLVRNKFSLRRRQTEESSSKYKKTRFPYYLLLLCERILLPHITAWEGKEGREKIPKLFLEYFPSLSFTNFCVGHSLTHSAILTPLRHEEKLLQEEGEGEKNKTSDDED